MVEIDARGRPCPQPVLMTKKAVDAGETHLIVAVDNEGSAQNVVRFAAKHGYVTSIAPRDGDFVVTMSRGDQPAGESEQRDTAIAYETGGFQVDVGQAILISTDTLGRGSDELGGILIQSLLNALAEGDRFPARIVLLNGGVKLVCTGSPVIDMLSNMESRGIDILACGTCLDYFDLKNDVAVGKISNAFEILTTLLEADRVIPFS